MSTITTDPRPPIAPSMVPAAPDEERGVMRGVSWNLYDRLTDAIGERSSIRVACRSAPSRGLNDGAVFPIPDLIAEIDISPPKVDRDAIYSKLWPLEVWRFSGGAVSIEHLGADGKYTVADASRFFYLRPEEVTQWLRDADSMTRPAWMRLSGIGLWRS